MKYVSRIKLSRVRRILLVALLLSIMALSVSRWSKSFWNQSASAQATVAVVNAASFANDANNALTPDSIGAAFGNFVTQNNGVFNATALPLPTTLGGVQVTINNVPAGLFFVAPQQINLLIPPNIADGDATIVVTNSDNTTRMGTFRVVRAAPGVFSCNSTGLGVAAAVTTDDGIIFGPVAGPGCTEVPVSPGTSAKPNILLLFTTGIRNVPADNPMDGNGVAEAVTVSIQGVRAPVQFAGPAPGFAGLDQLNVVIPPELGAIRSVKITVTAGGRRSNTVTMDIGGEQPGVRLTPIALGETKTGELTHADQIQVGPPPDKSTFFFDAYSFTTTAPNTTVAVDLRSAQFDAAIFFYRIENNALSFLALDDESGGYGNGSVINHNSLLLTVLPTPGQYAIFATSSDFDPNGVGSYTLKLTPDVAQQLNYGQTTSGTAITTTDVQTSAGDFLDVFWFNGGTGDNVRINMNSTAFDSFLILQKNDGEIIASDDNSGGGNNAQITNRLQNSGIYVIIAFPFAPDITGGYTVSLNRLSGIVPEGNDPAVGFFKAPGREILNERNSAQSGRAKLERKGGLRYIAPE